LQRPFPEELNRRVADLIADAYFAPTVGSQDALLKEGVAPHRIHVTGNTVVDALLHVASLPFDTSKCSFSSVLTAPKIVLITAHRRESFGEPFYELCRAIRELALSFDAEGVQFVYPVHLNPRVQEPVKEILSGIRNVHLIEPLDYFNMVHLMRRCSLILTDSGGIQEEAPSFGVPVLVMRDTTERPEGVAAGVVRLVGTQSARIVSQATSILRSQEGWIKRPNPYGDGRAAQRIVSVLLEGAHS
jgi:UDP-N-acetylglucosamine 2-epimerase (non-hydrolysing)